MCFIYVGGRTILHNPKVWNCFVSGFSSSEFTPIYKILTIYLLDPQSVGAVGSINSGSTVGAGSGESKGGFHRLNVRDLMGEDIRQTVSIGLDCFKFWF